MRILIASDLHWPTINGIATFGRNLATGLAERGHEVMVVAPSQTGRKTEESDGLYTISRTASLIFPFYQNLRVSVSPQREMKHIVQQFQPDVIHVQTPLGIGVAAVNVAKKLHIPLVATNHAMSENLIENLRLLAPFAKPIDRLLREYGSRFYANADYMTFPTTAAIAMQRPESFTTPHMAISNGVELSRFQPGPADAAVAERFGIDPKRPVVMYLGRIDAEKQVSTLVKAAALVPRHFRLQLMIVGFGNDLENLKKLAQELKLADDVVFTGRIAEDDKPAILRLASIFVMTSPAELQSIAMLEAMATGLPVVAVNAGALYELCHDSKNGFLYKLGQPNELASHIETLLNDKELMTKFGSMSQELASHHDLGETIGQFEALYETVLKQRREIA